MLTSDRGFVPGFGGTATAAVVAGTAADMTPEIDQIRPPHRPACWDSQLGISARCIESASCPVHRSS